MTLDPLEHFERIAALASEEAVPTTTVADRVLDSLSQQSRVTPPREPEYALFGYSTVAAACAALVLFTLNSGDDSLVILAEPFMTVLP